MGWTVAAVARRDNLPHLFRGLVRSDLTQIDLIL